MPHQPEEVIMFFASLIDPFGTMRFWQESVAAATKLGTEWVSFNIDLSQRAILMADTLIERGENSLEKRDYFSRYEMKKILDGKDSQFPCNYNLMEVIPPKELGFRVTKDRPALICPPYTRKPGIEVTAEVNQALAAWELGYKVYYLQFNPTPVKDQLVDDTVRTTANYIKYLHRTCLNPKGPILIGNCQAGWHALLAGLNDPGLKYTLSAIGSPMSYWSGAPHDDSLRFSGASIGGAWAAAFLSDLLGGEVFDGANLSLNFDALHSEENFFLGRWLRTFFGIDTGKEGFLEMERWMTNFCQLSRPSILWILRNLFIGNKLERGKLKLAGKTLDMRDHPNLLILLSSLGDNIATVWQCQSWIPIVWKDIETLKRSGKTIVTVTHPSAGHLGIFFSGKVARGWHGTILRNLEELEELPAGLFRATPLPDGSMLIEEMTFDELPKPNEQGMAVLEKAATGSERNLALYETFLSPFVKALSPWVKGALFHFHPYRLQRYPFIGSAFNPFFNSIKLLAASTRQIRQPVDSESDNFFMQAFKLCTGTMSGTLKHLHDTKVSCNRELVCNYYS